MFWIFPVTCGPAAQVDRPNLVDCCFGIVAKMNVCCLNLLQIGFRKLPVHLHSLEPRPFVSGVEVVCAFLVKHDLDDLGEAIAEFKICAMTLRTRPYNNIS